jgi:hypothetical protein
LIRARDEILGEKRGIAEQETMVLRKAYPVLMYQNISPETLEGVAFSP